MRMKQNRIERNRMTRKRLEYEQKYDYQKNIGGIKYNGIEQVRTYFIVYVVY